VLLKERQFQCQAGRVSQLIVFEKICGFVIKKRLFLSNIFVHLKLDVTKLYLTKIWKIKIFASDFWRDRKEIS
jgi:hypothetical protein